MVLIKTWLISGGNPWQSALLPLKVVYMVCRAILVSHTREDLCQRAYFTLSQHQSVILMT